MNLKPSFVLGVSKLGLSMRALTVNFFILGAFVAFTSAIDDHVARQAVEKAGEELDLEAADAMVRGARTKRSAFRKITPE